MKKMIVIVFLFVTVTGYSQITGRFSQYQYIPERTITDTSYFPIQVDGRNYTWQLWSSWADSSVLTTSNVEVQTSKDGINWARYANMPVKVLSAMNGQAPFEDVNLPGTWLRYVFNVASNDTVYGLSCTYTLKINE